MYDADASQGLEINVKKFKRYSRYLSQTPTFCCVCMGRVKQDEWATQDQNSSMRKDTADVNDYRFTGMDLHV